MIEALLYTLKEDKKIWTELQDVLIERKINARTILLQEGEIATNIFLIKKGCLREWFNKDGKDITFQFFFENQPVASIDSFMNQKPSLFTIESIEPSTVLTISKTDFDRLQVLLPEFKTKFDNFIFQRFRNYGQLFLSRIKDTPQERYKDLLQNNPEVIQRIPQHYIASFLGITPISLSRIRNRK